MSFYPGWGCTFVVFFFGLGMENVVIGVGQSKFTATKSGPNSPPQISTPIFLAQRRAPKSTLLGTRESNKKHDDLEHDFFAGGRAPKITICTKEFRRRAPKSTILGTKESTQKQTKESIPQRRAPKSTILGTKESTKKHDLEHDRESTKKHNIFLARRTAPKSTI